MSGNSPSTELASSPVTKADSSSTTIGANHDQPSEVKEQTVDELVTSLKAKDTSKVIVRFSAIGNAPILKQSYYKITGSNKFQTVIQFLRKELKYQGSDPLFLYINSAFSPAPDEIVANLYKASLSFKRTSYSPFFFSASALEQAVISSSTTVQQRHGDETFIKGRGYMLY